MAAGTPVITGEIGDRSEMLGHGAAGLLVPPGNVRSFSSSGCLRLCCPIKHSSVSGRMRQPDHTFLPNRWRVNYWVSICSNRNTTTPLYQRRWRIDGDRTDRIDRTYSNMGRVHASPRKIDVGALISRRRTSAWDRRHCGDSAGTPVGPTVFRRCPASMTLAKVSSVLFTLGLDTWLLRNSVHAGEPGSTIASASATSLAIKFGLGSLWLLMLTLLAPLLNSPSFPQSIVALSAFIVWLDEFAATAWIAFQAKLYRMPQPRCS